MKKINIYTHFVLRILEFGIFVILLAYNFNWIEFGGKSILIICFAIIGSVETYYFYIATSKLKISYIKKLITYFYIFVFITTFAYYLPSLLRFENESLANLIQAIAVTLLILYSIILLFVNLFKLLHKHKENTPAIPNREANP